MIQIAGGIILAVLVLANWRAILSVLLPVCGILLGLATLWLLLVVVAA